jgi:DNA-binding MarR family transcriptional regulator
MKIEKEIKQKKFDNAWARALVNLHYTSNVYEDKLLQILKPHNINDQHYNVLRILKGQHPEAVCPGYIKEVLLNKRGDLTRLIDKLTKLGHVSRQTNAENRRMVDISITDPGINLLKKLGKEVKTIQKIKKNLSEEEAILLSELLDKMRG